MLMYLFYTTPPAERLSKYVSLHEVVPSEFGPWRQSHAVPNCGALGLPPTSACHAGAALRLPNSQSHSWFAVKEFNLSYHIMDRL